MHYPQRRFRKAAGEHARSLDANAQRRFGIERSVPTAKGIPPEKRDSNELEQIGMRLAF
jgi:hypothetical protein